MNKFTKDFFAATFTGYKHEEYLAEQKFWTNKVIPFVETDFDLSVESTHKWCINNQQLIKSHNNLEYAATQNQENDWFSAPHSKGWHRITLKGESLSRNVFVNSGEVAHIKKNRQPLNYKIDLETQLKSIGFELKYLIVVHLAPGGWAQPHIDPLYTGMSFTMDYFWIPLHDAKPSLKIYPYGLLQQKTACVYWLNNASFVHGILNDSDMDRYVVIGRINLKESKMSLKDKIYQEYLKQWYK